MRTRRRQVPDRPVRRAAAKPSIQLQRSSAQEPAKAPRSARSLPRENCAGQTNCRCTARYSACAATVESGPDMPLPGQRTTMDREKSLSAAAARVGASKLPSVGTTIFTVISALAQEHGAVNLGQGFPDFDCDPQL